VVATNEHMNSASFSTLLKLMAEDAEPGEPGRYYPGNPRLMVPKDSGTKAASPRVASPEMSAPTISVSAVAYGAPPALGTSVASIIVGHRRMTRASKVRLLSSGHRIL
jgi:hypothetical protein